MAVDILTDTSSSRGMSPRISFSHDLSNCDILPIEPHAPLKSSLLDYDFDFCVSKRNCDQDSSLADELFANGIILPIQIKRKDIPNIPKSKSSSSSSSSSSSCLLSPPHSSAQSISAPVNVKKTEEKQEKDDNKSNDENKSFWTFKRSNSVNCGRFYRRGLCSLPLLLRSKSTGSTASVKKSLITSVDDPHLHKKQGSLKKSSSTQHQKPPLKKNYGGSSFNSGLVQVSPVLNFSFRSVFSNGKDKGKKK